MDPWTRRQLAAETSRQCRSGGERETKYMGVSSKRSLSSPVSGHRGRKKGADGEGNLQSAQMIMGKSDAGISRDQSPTEIGLPIIPPLPTLQTSALRTPVEALHTTVSALRPIALAAPPPPATAAQQRGTEIAKDGMDLPETFLKKRTTEEQSQPGVVCPSVPAGFSLTSQQISPDATPCGGRAPEHQDQTRTQEFLEQMQERLWEFPSTSSTSLQNHSQSLPVQMVSNVHSSPFGEVTCRRCYTGTVAATAPPPLSRDNSNTSSTTRAAVMKTLDVAQGFRAPGKTASSQEILALPRGGGYKEADGYGKAINNGAIDGYRGGVEFFGERREETVEKRQASIPPEGRQAPQRSLCHAHLVEQARETEDNMDFLKKLYPHARDGDCWMDELHHKYYVHEESYPYSVSSVWKVFFPQFDTAASAGNAIRSASERGLKCLETSIFNLAQHLLYVERVSPTSAEGKARVQLAVEGATQWFERQGGGTPPFTAERVQAAVAELCAHVPMVKPRKPACYFLSYCLGASEADVREQWRLNGALESFKGTFLHKQAELFMQSLGKRQHFSGRSRVPLRVLLAETETMRAARHSARPATVMRLLAPHTSVDLWDHPSTQAFLEEQLHGGWSIEFLKFEAWLRRHPEPTPFRSEWSIYDEEERLAGKIDSLWLDTNAGDALVMADWKRAKFRLESDPALQEKEAFRGERGLAICGTSILPGPCADLYHCAYNHYLAQQNLYAYFLERHYELRVARIFLVQCHPEVGLGSEDFHEAPVTYDSALARRMLEAFRDGWKELLPREENDQITNHPR